MKVLSLDPGKKNSFAYALIEDGKCVRTGVLWSIEELTPNAFHANYVKFAKQIRKLITDCGLQAPQDRIIVERYITRPGMGMGNNSEFINIMIGILTMVALPLTVTAIPSSQWKNHIRKTYSIGKETKSKSKTTVKCKYENVLDFLNKNYPNSTKSGPKKDWLVIHEADALGIGVYWWEELTGKCILDTVWDSMENTVPVE